MKNLSIAFFIVASLLFTSCDDAIDITQPSELLPEVTYQTVEDLTLGLNGVYGAAPGESGIYFTSLFTDEAAIGANNGGQGTNGELAFLLNSNTDDPASIWVGYYGLINAANRVIQGAEYVEVEAGSIEESTKKDILAQVHALRAYGHLMLMAYFCPDMAEDSSLGVIALDYVPATTDNLPRNTAGEVYALILSDLDFADANIDTSATPLGRRQYITPTAILAIRARLAAYREQYELAKGYVDQIDVTMNLSGQTGSAATKRTQYENIFNDNLTVSTNESIWQLNRIPNPSTPTIGNFYQYWASVDQTVDGSPFFEVGRALFNKYLDNDVRKFVVVDPSAVVATSYSSLPRPQYLAQDILPVGKYRFTDNANLNGDIKVFRFSEMVLIRAEYYASIGDFANVLAQINSIRAARNAPLLEIGDVTGAEAWGKILDERRLELAFEGHRYIDLKRLGTLGNRGVDRDEADCNFNGFCDLPASDFRFTMPIPRAERVANPNIQQNPGY